MWKQARGFAHSLYGLLPYSAKLRWGLQFAKKDGYAISRSVPYLTAEITSLDYVWRGEVFRERGQLKFTCTNPRATDDHIALRWSAANGWTLQGVESGRRTRPLPKFIAAILCGTLIWVYPDILRIVLEHAEKANEPAHVYLLLAAVTVTLVLMVGLYMWFGYKAEPSGLEKLLKGVAKSIGRDGSKQGSTLETRTDSGMPAAQPLDAKKQGGGSGHTDKMSTTDRDGGVANGRSADGAPDHER